MESGENVLGFRANFLFVCFSVLDKANCVFLTKALTMTVLTPELFTPLRLLSKRAVVLNLPELQFFNAVLHDVTQL